MLANGGMWRRDHRRNAAHSGRMLQSVFDRDCVAWGVWRLLINKVVTASVLAALCWTITTAHAAASEAEAKFARLKDSGLVELLSNLQVLADHRFKSDLRVKVLQATYGDECDPDREALTCPRSELLIVLTSERGPPTVWRSPRRIGWQTEKLFNGIEPGKDADQANVGHLRFAASVCEASADVEAGNVNPHVGGWWLVRKYDVDVSLAGVEMRRVNGSAPTESCNLY